MRLNLCAFLAVLLCTLAASPAFAAASLTPLGDLPGAGFYSIASGVSADGTVVVGTGTSASSLFGQEAIRWTSDGGMVGLGFLPGGALWSSAGGVSADGSVVVGTSVSEFAEAFRWTSSEGMIGLGTLPGEYQSFASAVSADGSTVVGSSQRSAGVSNYYEAFRWTSDGGMVGLGDLPGGEFRSAANDISAAGSVIVGFSDSASGNEAFRWTSDGGMVGLGDLPGGGFYSQARRVSGDGSVIVGQSDSASGLEAFRWTNDGGMIGLGTLPGQIQSFANAVSADGSTVVGFRQLSAGVDYYYEAFHWTSDRGIKRLWDVLLAEGVDPAADGWTSLGGANGISADGSTIVGYGTRNGNAEAFVAVLGTIPEPSAGALALLGASSILLLRRRCVWRPNEFLSAPPLPGDFNGDNVIDAADYVVWRKNNIDVESGYNTSRANFGALSPGAAAVAHSVTSVPEPAAGALALLAVSGTLLLRRAMAGALTLIVPAGHARRACFRAKD